MNTGTALRDQHVLVGQEQASRFTDSTLNQVDRGACALMPCQATGPTPAAGECNNGHRGAGVTGAYWHKYARADGGTQVNVVQRIGRSTCPRDRTRPSERAG